MTPHERLFLTDFRYVEQAEAQVVGYERIESGRDMLGELAGRLRGRAGFEDSHVTVATHAKLGEKLRRRARSWWRPGRSVEELRAVKDPSEIAAMRAAAELADAAYGHMRERGLAGRTEREVAITATRTMVDRGRRGAVVPADRRGGSRRGAPARGAARRRDTAAGARRGRHGRPGRRLLLRLHPHVRHRARSTTARRGLRAGAAGAAGGARRPPAPAPRCPPWTAWRATIIEAAGHGERFGHGLGHGVGLEVHEGPRVAKTASGRLDAGNAVTVEPGVYIPGELGVRIEDLVVVTDGEPDVLTGFPKDLVTTD